MLEEASGGAERQAEQEPNRREGTGQATKDVRSCKRPPETCQECGGAILRITRSFIPKCYINLGNQTKEQKELILMKGKNPNKMSHSVFTNLSDYLPGVQTEVSHVQRNRGEATYMKHHFTELYKH